MDLLRAMSTFIRVVDTGSLSAAGRDLGLSQSAVSQQIAALEQHLAVRLIRRTTRQMTLTDAGADYYQRAKMIIDAVHEATETAAGHAASLSGPLRIHAPVTLTKALVAGFGIGAAQLPLISAELQTGQLVRLMTEFEYTPLDVHAVYPSRRFIPAKVRAFVDFLQVSTKDAW